MPIALLNDLYPDCRLGLWNIEEPIAWFEDILRPDDSEQAQLLLLKESKQLEFLAVRHLLHVLTSSEKREPLQKDAWGKPFLPHSPLSISLSHSHGIAAAITASRSVGIDIQYMVEKTERIIAKFMRPDEQEALSSTFRLPHLHVYWCAKEALYKAYGRKELNFCQHLFIEPFTYSEQGGELSGYIRKADWELSYRLYYLPFGSYMLVWVLESDSLSDQLLR